MAAKIPSLEDYESAGPYEKGFMSYTFSHWPESAIPEINPYQPGTAEAEKFADGVHAAILCAQDSED